MIKILLAEDDVTMVSLLKMLLELEGYMVVCPSFEKSEILSLIRQEKPDLILLDVHLGEQNGLEVVKKLRESVDICKIRVIMTSGMNLSDECKKAGADDFLFKPYMPDELLIKIKKPLSS
jgi:two-component system OmpR family response regulator